MPAVELVFPPLKPDAQLLADFALNKPKIFRPFIGVNGLKTTLVGRITEDAGKSIEENTGRAAMVLVWDNISSFHNFYPKSSAFHAFVTGAKPYLAGPATPELYETPTAPVLVNESISVMQLVKVPITNDGVQDAWKNIEDSLRNTNACTHSANGVEVNEGVFLGLIGWDSVKEYELRGKDKRLLERINRLSGEVKLMVVQLSTVKET